MYSKLREKNSRSQTDIMEKFMARRGIDSGKSPEFQSKLLVGKSANSSSKCISTAAYIESQQTRKNHIEIISRKPISQKVQYDLTP